ncbi:MAG: DNA repair protein RecN [Myxococcales bacterium]|nr:DNA repair protein RecN [Myxococcales bacterium]MCB9628010.1 DNA repair protein RecN [Sandaracinaceae bacterium]
MLTCVRVRNFAIIDELEVELGSGLNVFTGETGAGKSILVSALQLVLGGKARPDVVRTGADQAEVEALFDISRDPSARARMVEAGIEVEEDEPELVIRRVIQANGRTRAFINGQMATAGQLAQVTSGLADISSQHQYHTLVDARTHLGYLDAFAGLDADLAAITEAHRRFADADARVQELVARHRDRGQREDMLRFQLKEIDDLAPRADEEEELLAERSLLRHAEKLSGVAGGAEHVLYAADAAVCEKVARVVSDLRSGAVYDPRLNTIADQVEAAQTQLEDAASELGRYARGVNVDPARLALVEERADRLARLKRKYGGTLADVIALRAKVAVELADLDDFEAALSKAEHAREVAREAASKIALRLREERKKAASKLSRSISAELASLGMGDAQVEVDVQPLEGRGGELDIDGARLSPTGIDRAEFLIAPNRGEAARPLAKVASGGELSRAMLAIKRVLAGVGPAGLYVFDEVDSGVGGAVAEVIGQKLNDVAAHSQVLCITHLAQIAVYGDAHFRVHKEVLGERTHSRVSKLAEGERLEEVARMLGGLTVTAATRTAAAEMLAGAAKASAGAGAPATARKDGGAAAQGDTAPAKGGKGDAAPAKGGKGDAVPAKGGKDGKRGKGKDAA